MNIQSQRFARTKVGKMEGVGRGGGRKEEGLVKDYEAREGRVVSINRKYVVDLNALGSLAMYVSEESYSYYGIIYFRVRVFVGLFSDLII